MLNLINKYINEDGAVLQKVILPGLKSNIEIFVKREDLLHPTISGNKWRKLKYNLLFAHKNNYKTILTFGGAFSNHIHATASAGSLFGFKTIGIIRGEEHLPLNPTLKFSQEKGMQIYYVDRTSYRDKSEEDFVEELHNRFGEFYLVPEGGTNQLAIKGCTEIIDDIDIEFDYIASACGTGGTLSGLICGLHDNKKIIGVPVLKGANFLKENIRKLVLEYSDREYNNWELFLDYHFGGYAKINSELIKFITEFEDINNIHLDPIYTAKLFFGIHDLIKHNKIDNKRRIILLHTGGLQGREGMKDKINKIINR